MIVNEDGGVTGSIDVSKLDEVEPKTDEARAQLEQLKAEAQSGQEQAARDAARLAEQSAAQNPLQAEPAGDTRDAQGKEQEGRPQGGTQQAEGSISEAATTTDAGSGDQGTADAGSSDQDVDTLRTEAEGAGVTVDKRWGADRLRQEIDQANASKASQQSAQSRKQGR